MTGQTLVLSPDEQAPYARQWHAQMSAANHAATVQLNETTDAITAATTVAKLSKTLSTYSIYETRRRRFADAIEEKLTTLVNDRQERLKSEIPQAAKLAKAMKANGKPFNPADFGFVCSAEDIDQFLEGQELARSCQNPPPQAAEKTK